MGSGWIDKQMPEEDEIFLDHVGYFAADLEQAGDALERLGFQVSAVNVQYNADVAGSLVPSGTSNRLVKLRRGFVEVLAATSDTLLAAQLRQGLARYAGLHVVALTHPDMERQSRRLIEEGFAPQPLVNLRRSISTVQGERQMAYSILRTDAAAMPEGRIQMLTTHTPDLFWTAGVFEHPNRADALTDLLIGVDNPRTAAARFARFTKRSPVGGDGLWAIALDRGRLLLAGGRRIGDILPGFSASEIPIIVGQGVASSDMDTTQRFLTAAGVAPIYADDTMVCVGPSDALGGYLLFHATAMTRPWETLLSLT
jgi:hypothetical protein